MSKYVRSLTASAAIVVLTIVPAMAAQPMAYAYETPEQNVARSAAYDQLLETSIGFRHYRMRKECNPIRFVPGLRQDCFASFDQYEPFVR